MGQMITADDVRTLHDYEEVRSEMRRRAVALRKMRRLQVGDKVTVTFENRETILFRLQEAVRDEGITGREALEAECEAYAALLPSKAELSATLFIDVTPGRAAVELKELAGICDSVTLALGEQLITARVDEGSNGEDMASTTCYIRFPLTREQVALVGEPDTPMRMRIDHPNYEAAADVAGGCRRLIAEDLE